MLATIKLVLCSWDSCPPLDPHPGGLQNDGKTGLRAETQIYDEALSSYEQKSEELCTTSGLILKKKLP